MIPKVIHYCWFGGNPLSPIAVKCLDSWKKYCPDYEIIEWNEKSFDINICPYVKEAFENRKWAFITDFVRLYVLYNNGGIYMDTDVEVVAPLDKFLVNHGFSGFESDSSVSTGIMASEKGNPFIGKLLADYDNRHFVKADGTLNMTTNTFVISEIAVDMGLILNNAKQTICDFTFYPKDYFCPKDCRTLKIHLTENTTTIHHFSGSWGSQGKKKIKDFLKKLLGEKLCLWISNRKSSVKKKRKQK